MSSPTNFVPIVASLAFGFVAFVVTAYYSQLARVRGQQITQLNGRVDRLLGLCSVNADNVRRLTDSNDRLAANGNRVLDLIPLTNAEMVDKYRNYFQQYANHQLFCATFYELQGECSCGYVDARAEWVKDNEVIVAAGKDLS